MIEKINTNGFEFVDLGLPSGTLWSTCNVGASNPSDFGLYFQWGDVQGYTAEQVGTKKRFANDFSDYKWSVDGSSSNFNKYKTEGDILELKDDAAHANMGGDWHMPTPEQIQELINETNNTWTEQGGVFGRLFTSKKNGKSIFIPAAGNARDGSIHNSGDYGYVWSSMLNTYLVFVSGYAGLYYSSLRSNGFSVRGVLDKSALKVSDSHKHFELNDKVLVGIAFNGRHTWRRDIYLRYDEDKKTHCTFYESSVPDSLIIPYDIDKEGKEVPFGNIMSSLFK